MGGVVKAVSNVVSSVGNAVASAAGSVTNALGNVLGGNGGGGWDPLGDVFRWAGNTVKAVLDNPLPVIETVGLTLMGVPSPVASSMVTAMNGGSMEQIITAGVTSYVGGQVGQSVGAYATDAGASAATAAVIAGASGASVGATLNGLANGKSLSDSLASGLTAGAFAGLTKSVNLGMNAAATELNTPTPNADNLNIPPLTPSDSPLSANNVSPTIFPSGGESLSPLSSNLESSPLSPVDALTPSEPMAPSDIPTTQPIAPDSIESSPLPALTSEPSQTTQPLTLPPEINEFPDTSVNPNYAINSTVTPKLGADEFNAGIKASPLTTGASDVGYTPVDTGLVNLNSLTGAPTLELPTSPAIKAMGGGQGLTADVTNPVTGDTGVVGGLGYTPTGAAPVLGDPSSFINNPNVTGQPVMAVDPAYYDVTLPKVSLGKSISSGLASLPLAAFAGSAGSTGTTGTSTISPLDTAKVAESYLTTHMVNGQPLTLPQLKQLYPEVVPELSKLLVERGMNLNQSTQPINFLGDTQNQPSQNSADLNPITLANFTQPSEDVQYSAKGGSMKLPKGHKPEFITGQTGHYAQGRGTGQSDEIPAVLHDGDYVVDADTVAAFGDGSSKAGAGALEQFRRSIPEHRSGGGQPIPAQIADGEYVLPAGFVTSLGHGSNKQGAKMLDAMREQIRAHKRSAPDTKIPPKAKSPLQYMREAMKG